MDASQPPRDGGPHPPPARRARSQPSRLPPAAPVSALSALRLGVLGGTFDPPHYGHLLLAQEAAWQLGLEQVLFLPAGQNPLKQDEPVSPAEHRARMVELAIGDNPLFACSRRDLDRPPPSYTVDLLRLLKAELPPGTELCFLVGADVLHELPAWHRPDDLSRLAHLVVAGRPGWPAPALAAFEQALPATARGRVTVIRMPGVDISSTDIRARARAGQPVRYLLPPAVERYAGEQRLYVSGADDPRSASPRSGPRRAAAT